jgi:polyferredoxin
MKTNTRIRIHRALRLGIQAAFFIACPGLYAAAFNGIKYLAYQMAAHEAFTWNPFLMNLTALLAVTILFGRVFCGYACAFGSVGDWLYALSASVRKKLRGRARALPFKAGAFLRHIKYAVLAVILAACLTGRYPLIAPYDPWEMFAALRAGDFDMAGRWPMALSLGLIACGMCFVERFFCRFLCPLGAVFALMPTLPFMTFARRREKCISGCRRCVSECPADIALGEPDAAYGECFQCGKCAAGCPIGNVRFFAFERGALRKQASEGE